MKRLLVIAAIFMAAILLIAGCKSKSSDSQAKAKAAAAANSPQNQAALQAAQVKVAGCLAKGNLLTKTGRTAIMTCVAPPAQQQALKKCALDAAGKEHMTTKAGRKQWEQVDLPNCVVQAQKGAK